jgi:hypothetical protein
MVRQSGVENKSATKKRDFLGARFLYSSETKKSQLRFQTKSFGSTISIYYVAAVVNRCHAVADLFAAAFAAADDHSAFFDSTDPDYAVSPVRTAAFDSVDLAPTDQHSLRMPLSA